MIVRISELPLDIRSQIPISIRLREEVETNSLPLKVKQIVEEYLKNSIKASNKEVLEETYDVHLNKGSYDFQYMTNIKEAVKNYIMNFFLIRKGTYPYDPTFGTTIYKYLQAKNTATVELVINNELTELITQIQELFGNTYIRILNVSLQSSSNYGRGTIFITISLEVNNEKVSMKFNLNEG